MQIGADIRDQVLTLYERGLFLQAYAVAQPYGPLTQWEGTEARILAGRLAGRLGGERAAAALHLRAWRADQSHHEAVCYGVRTLMYHRSPLVAWEAVQRAIDFADAEPGLRADWLALNAMILGVFRDFESADDLMRQALALDPDEPWLRVEQSALLQMEDQPDEALVAARRALEMRQSYLPGFLATAYALGNLDRREQALELLTEADAALESCTIALQRAVILTELDRFDEAAQALDRAEILSPLADRDHRRTLAGLQSDVACLRGDLADARRLAIQSNSPFHRVVAERLSNVAPDAKRVCLAVPFVRQHYDTCAPATLSSIAHFWGDDVEHVDVADAICYAGTASHRQRQWADERDWVTREFTLSWDSAVALLDRGVPFTLTLIAPGSGHLVAAIGYDARRGTLLLRDPSNLVKGEVLVAELLEQLRSSGPKAMALVPCEKASLLDGLDLPDSELYDHLYTVLVALDAHDRPRAARACEWLASEHPGHRLTLEAALSLDFYDSDTVKALEHLGLLLEQFPQDANLRLAHLSSLQTLARREERLDLLRAYSAEKGAPSIILHLYGDELGNDARQATEVLAILRRALRQHPLSARCIFAMAGVLWNQQDRARSLALYRLAACLEDTNEGLARSYFIACRHLRQTEVAVGYLRDRYERFGTKSAWPAQSLFWALEECGRTHDGFSLLEEAEQRRPDDGDLLLFSVDARARFGQFAEAERVLVAARPHASDSAWLRSAAGLASYRGDRAEALARWREVLAGQPLALDAHRAVAQLVAETEGRDAAMAHLRAACERFPFHEPLHELQVSWLRGHDDEAAESVVRHVLDVNPVNGWARRELALILADLRRLDDALAEADAAVDIDPSTSASHGVKGNILARAGRVDEAKESIRSAIRVSVDNSDAVNELVSLCIGPEERREALVFVQAELVRQVIFGNALFAFRQAARQVLSADDVLGRLREAHAARPDLWQSWSALVDQLTQMNHLDEVHAVASEAIERFPLMPWLWTDLASVERLRGNETAQRAAIEKALSISPNWDVAVRALADSYEQSGDFTSSRDLMERAVASAPFDPWNHGYLAFALWRLGEQAAALTRIQRALELEPDYQWAWDTLRDWSREISQPHLLVEAARALTERRGGEARSWLILARSLDQQSDLPERLSALERAADLNPRDSRIHDLRAELLAGAGRFDEARAACRPAAFGDSPPPELQGRAAWIEAQSGNTVKAIAEMLAVVVDNPEYWWGWARLSEWCESVGRKQDALHAAKRLTEISPGYAVSWGILAHAAEQVGNRAGAREYLLRALALDPSYANAGFRHFDLALEDGDTAAAAETLQRLKSHVGGAYVVARAVELAARVGDISTALGEMRNLCRSAEDSFEPFEMALAGLARAQAGGAAESALRELLRDPRANQHTGRLWVEAHAAVLPLVICAWRLSRLRADSPACREAAARIVELCGGRRQAWLVRAFIALHRPWLRADTRTWASAGYALAATSQYRQAAAWLADWETRAGVEQWMLYNLAESLRVLGLDAQAGRISLAALRLPPDSTILDHTLWLALDAALAGDTGEATRLLGADPPTDKAERRLLVSLVRVLLDWLSRTDPGSDAAYAEARAGLRKARVDASALREPRAFERACLRVESALSKSGQAHPNHV